MKSFHQLKHQQNFRYPPSKVLKYPGPHAFIFHDSENSTFFQSKFSRKVELSKVIIPHHQQKFWLRIYEWRNNTELPIAKIYYVTIKEQKNQMTQLTIFGEHFPHTLDDFKDIQLIDALYLIKQSLIGCQRLYSKFGGFQISPRMIGINQNKKCKVWLSEDYQINIPKSKIISQKKFIQNIVNMFPSFTQRNYLSKIFFIGIKNTTRFVQAFKYIDSFAQENHIKIPFKLTCEANKCSYKIKLLNFVQCPIIKSIQHSKRSNQVSPSCSRNQLRISAQKGQQRSIQTETQGTNAKKLQNQPNKLLTHQNKFLFVQDSNIRSIPDEDFNEQQYKNYSCTPQYKPNNTVKLSKVFKSDINFDEGFNQSQKCQAKLKKINSQTEEKKSFQSSKAQSLNVIEEAIEDKLQFHIQNQNEEDQDSIYETKQHNLQMLKKNKWDKLLISDMIDQMKESIILGKQIEVFNERKLQKLGSFGRQIKESLIISPD